MIDVENLTKDYGTLTAVDGLSLHVNEGEVFGFLGPNGAGKTTTVRMLCCLISRTRGTARIDDYDITNKEDQKKIRRIIGLLPENVGLYDDLSPLRNLDFFGRLYKCPESQRTERAGYFLRMLDLWEKRDVPAGTLSKGMKQKLAIARALIHDPQVLFLDEPTANLDPEASKTVRDFILELKKEKRTIFLNTHNLDEADRICDRVAIMKTKLIAVDSPENMRHSLWGRQTIIQLETVNDEIVEAVKRAKPRSLDVDDSRLVIGVSDPEKDNPDIVRAISAAGGRIQFVTESRPTLEDVYLKLVGG
jgi:ABC-2 type transport system ATP-binding protein